MEHALGWLKDFEKYDPEFVVLLRPTSPFRTTATIDRAIELLRDNPKAHCVRTVRLCSEHPHKMWVMDEGGRRIRSLIPVEQKLPEAHTLSYQLLPTIYIQNASMDVFRASNVWQLCSTTGTEIVPLVNDEYESVDINTEIDFLLAEALIARKAPGAPEVSSQGSRQL